MKVLPKRTTSLHDEYVALGYCDFIDRGKTWCNGKNGHLGNHWAVRVLHEAGHQIVELDSPRGPARIVHQT